MPAPTHILHGRYPVVVASHANPRLVTVTYVGPAVPDNRRLGQTVSASRFDFDGNPTLTQIPTPYQARPFAVRWCDSHSALTNRFETYDEAFDYIQTQWKRIAKTVSSNRYHSSDLWHSYLETPQGKVQLAYVLLGDDVSSY